MIFTSACTTRELFTDGLVAASLRPKLALSSSQADCFSLHHHHLLLRVSSRLRLHDVEPMLLSRWL
jgi:hypothetical protein